MAGVQTVVFDVNETMSDMRPLAARFADVGAPESLATTWFAATLRDGFALSTAGTPRRFADVAAGVLSVLWAGLGDAIDDPRAATEHVLSGFTSLSLHPDIAPGVRALRDAGLQLATMSNGAASVADGLLERAGLRQEFDHVLTVDDAGAWKPDRRAYEYAAATCARPVDACVLVAVHPWDLHGARQAGMRTAYIDRSGAPYPVVFATPDHVVDQLAELPAALATRG